MPASALSQVATVDVGGETARSEDTRHQISGSMWKIVLFVLALSFLVLMVMLRSLVLPLKAVLMNLLSIGAAFGVLVAIFQWGWFDSLLGFESQGALDTINVPLIFAIVFGLSMDYEVFLMSRIRERYMAHGDNDRAVAEGLASSARTISSAALIMTCVFAAFVLTGVPSIKELGLGCAVAIAIDATLVRLILVPAAMKLLGDWNWWMPSWLDRVLPEPQLRGRLPRAGARRGLSAARSGLSPAAYPCQVSAEQWQKRFEWPIAIAALAVIPILIIEDSDAGGAWPAIGAVLNWCSWGVFLAEIVVMLSVVRDRRAWLLQHPLDVAIVVLTPPFVPLLGARLLRLLRVLRLLMGGVKLSRLLSIDGIRVAGVLVLTVVITGGAAFAAVESQQGLSTWDGVWWAVTTVTTVGYGEIEVESEAGRVIAIADHVRRHRLRRPRHRVHRRALFPQGRRRGGGQRGRQGGSDPRRAAAAERRGCRTAGA